MKSKFWFFQIPIILVCTFAFWVNTAGEQGELHHRFLRNDVFPYLRSISGKFTNIKFLLRGRQEPKNKVVIVGIDESSLESYGRWPWHRNYIAFLIEKILDQGAKVVGLDIVFAEEDRRVPNELAEVLRARGMGHLIRHSETDPILATTLLRNQSRIVLGWATENGCQPGYSKFEECPATHEDAISSHPIHQKKFSYQHIEKPSHFDPQQTPLMSLVTFISNLPMYNGVAKHAGTFNIWPDSDGYVRRTPLVVLADGTPYPTLALEMARAGLKEELGIKINDDLKVERIYWKKANQTIPSSPLGTLEMNFRGPSYTFPYISAEEVMNDNPKIHVGMNREIASEKSSILNDAYVLIGATAVGIYDMRAFPFDSNTPGVEGHATILDNLLSDDFLVASASGNGTIYVFLFMILGAGIFAYYTQRLNAIPALFLFLGSMIAFGAFDQFILFQNNINWNTSFLFIETLSLFVFAIAAKYVSEEREKKFIHNAFGKYVSPDMVDEIVKDPKKLSLGGEKKELTILFSDIRGFTTMSEKMDAKFLAKFLNDYLGTMTDIIVNETGGTLDKYIGDAIMAFWGAPLASPHHGADACRSAVLMIQALDKLKTQFQQDYGIEVSIGIGINTGLVSVGNMGSEKNFNYTVLGDHVNLSSRLEGLTKSYGVPILTTRFTIDQIEHAGSKMPLHRTLDFVKVKGKKNSVELVQIIESNLSEKGLDLFEQGRVLYSNQKWDAAIQKFEAADELLRKSEDHSDEPSKMYIERCETFKNTPPSGDWDGSWEMTTK